MATSNSPWPTTLAPGITCLMCIREHPTTLLCAEELLLQIPLSLVQLHPCGHMYCTRCYEKLIFASGHFHQPLHCQAPECPRRVLVMEEEVSDNDVVLEKCERRLTLSSGNLCELWALRVSVLSQHERVAPGHFVLGSGRQADQNAAAAVWVFLAQSPTIDRLVNLVRKRVRERSLFYRVNGEGHSLDVTSLASSFDQLRLVQNYNSSQRVLTTPRLVQESRGNTVDVPKAYNSNACCGPAAPPPPFLAQKPIAVDKMQPSHAPPPPTTTSTTTTPPPMPVFGLNVDDLMKALAKEPSL